MSIAGAAISRREKIRQIFDHFDADSDGFLSRAELSALVAAVNPSVHFTPDQISSILDELLLSYADSSGLSLAGLVHTYDDGAGDPDLDFHLLFPTNPSPKNPNPRNPNDEIKYESTSSVVDDLETLIRARNPSPKDTVFSDISSDTEWSPDIDTGTEKASFRVGELAEIRAGIDRLPIPDEAFEAHMAMGRTLLAHRLYADAADSFRRGLRLHPVDFRARYWLGNALVSLGHPGDAKECYLAAVKLAETDTDTDTGRWSEILPQVRVNLGIILEREGLLINAIEHYREAVSLCPTHYRAMKLLGGALYGVGEYGPAEKALESAVLLKPDLVDAHCDLGSVLHATGEEDRAVVAFQKAIDLKHDHLDALYNLGCLFKDMGRYGRASEMYGRVLAIRPDHWRAHLNRAVSLLGTGEVEEANKALREAFKLTNRVELYDAIRQLKDVQGKNGEPRPANWVAVDADKFREADEKTTGVRELVDALWIRGLQKATKLGRCNVGLLKKEMEKLDADVVSEGSVKKSELEIILRRLLHYLQPETFQGAVKLINEKIWAVMDITGSGKLDVGMFLAIIAPLCKGSPDRRKRAAFDALSSGAKRDIGRADAAAYWRYLRVIYFPSQGFTDLIEIDGGSERGGAEVSFPEFVERFDDSECGFGVMSVLVKLERGERARESRHRCEVCRYRIGGLLLKETTCRFYLCPSCYSECKVPAAFQREEYMFKEYCTE